MGQNDSEIFSRLREIGEGVVRIDERTRRIYRNAGKVSALLRFLNSLDGKLADGKLTEEEADEIVAEAAKLAEELTA